MPDFVRSNIRSMAAYAPGEQPRDRGFIKLNTNENPYPPSPEVFEAIQRTLTGDALRKYPDPMGTRFCETAAKVLGVDPASILIGNGSDDILTIITRTLVPEGGLIVAPSPSYILYKSLAEIQGARYQTIPFATDWKIDASQLPADANLLFLPNPNSPSGTVLPADAIARLPGPLVVDEAYVDFAEFNCLELVQVRDDVVVTRSLSKSYALAGIRFGFAVANPELVEQFKKVKDSYNCDVLSLAAACAAIEDQVYLRSTRAKIFATRSRTTAALRQLGFAVCNSQANFVWCRRSDRDVKPIYEELKSRGLLVRYMSYPGYGDGLRISIGTDAEMERLMVELKEIV